MNLTLVWAPHQLNAVADADIDWFVECTIHARKQERVLIANLQVVDAFRVQRKLGNLESLHLEANGTLYEVDSDGRWPVVPEELYDKRNNYLMQLL